MMIEQDYETFKDRLHERYPLMFSGDYGGIAVDPGWWPIIESLCANIQRYTDWWNRNREDRPVVEQVVISQIKEKFGGLRFYYQGGGDKIDGMVRMAESWAEHHCEQCGAPGKIRNSTGWLKTLCDEHDTQRTARYQQFKQEN